MSTPNGRQPNTSPSPSGSQPVLPNGGKLVTGSLGSLSGLRGQQHPLMGRAGGMYSSEKPVPVDSTMRATAYSSRMPTSSANGVPGTKVGSSAITPVNAGANSRGTDISSSRGAIASQPLRGRNVVTLKESAKKPTVFKDSGSSRALSGLHSSDAGSARGARRDIQDGSEHERNRGTTDRDQEKDKSRGRSDRDREFERHGRVGRDTSRDRHTHRDASLRAGGSGSGSVRGADAGIGKRLYSPHASPKRSGTPISSQHSQSHTQHTQPMLSTAAAPLDAPSLVQGKGGTAQNYRVAGRPWANDSTGVGGAYTLSSSSQQSQVSGILPNYTQMRAQAFARGVAPNAQQALQADVQYQSTNRMGTAALTRGSAKERPGNSSGSSSTPMILQRKPQPQPQQQPQLNAGDSGRRDRGADGSRMPTVHAQQSMRHSSASAADPYAQRSRLGTGLGASTASKADGRTHQHAATQPPPPVSAQLQAPRVSQTRRVCSEPLRLVSKRFTFVGAAAKKVLVDAGDDCLVVGVMGTEGSDKAAVMESLIEYHTGIDPRASADRNDVGRDKGVERGSMRGTDEGITLRIAPRALFLDAAPVSVDVLDRAKDLVAHLGRGDTISGQYMGGRKDSQVGSAYGDSDSSLQKTARKSTSESASMAGVLRTEDSLVVRKVALLLSVCHVVVFVQPHPTSSMSLGFGSDLSSGRTPGSVNSFCWGGVLQRSAALLAPLHKHELASVYGKLTGTPAEDPQGSTGIQTGGQCGTSARGELVPTQNRYRNPKARVSDTESMSVMSDVYATLFDDFDPTSASLHPSLLFAYTNTPVWAFDALPKAEVFASLKSGLIGTRWAYKGAGAACYRKHLHTCVCPVISDNTGGLVSDERCGTSDEEMQDTLAASDGPVEAKSPSANSTHRGITPVQSTHRFVCCGSERGAHCCHSMFMAPVTGTKANLGPNRTENDTGATAWTSWVKRNSSWNSYSDAATYAFGRKSADSVNEQLVQTVLSTPRYAYPERTDCVTWLQRTEHLVSFLSALDAHTAEADAIARSTPAATTTATGSTKNETRSQRTTAEHPNTTAHEAKIGGDGHASPGSDDSAIKKSLHVFPKPPRRTVSSKHSTGTSESRTGPAAVRANNSPGSAKVHESESSRRSKASGTTSTGAMETNKSASSKSNGGRGNAKAAASVDAGLDEEAMIRSKPLSKPDQKPCADNEGSTNGTGTGNARYERTTGGIFKIMSSSNARGNVFKPVTSKSKVQDTVDNTDQSRPGKVGASNEGGNHEYGDSTIAKKTRRRRKKVSR